MSAIVRRAVLLLLSLAAGLAAVTAGPAQSTPSVRALALTFDDLPYVAIPPSDDLADARRVTEALLAALAAHHAPAIGFVNEGKLQVAGETPARTALLARWVEAGLTLGNHTYSHPDLNGMTAEAFEDEIARGEVVTRRLMAGRRPYQLYFRHPQTHTGDTREKKEAVERYLAARGYRVAPHTVETSDFIFNTLYVQARRRGDDALAERLRGAYLDFSIAATAFAERVSPRIFGREIPQTLLIHANDLNADALDALLARFEARGYRFVTLDTVMADEAYGTPDTLVSRFGPTWLFRWMKSLGQSVSFADDPEPAAWVTELYERRPR